MHRDPVLSLTSKGIILCMLIAEGYPSPFIKGRKSQVKSIISIYFNLRYIRDAFSTGRCENNRKWSTAEQTRGRQCFHVKASGHLGSALSLLKRQPPHPFMPLPYLRGRRKGRKKETQHLTRTLNPTLSAHGVAIWGVDRWPPPPRNHSSPRPSPYEILPRLLRPRCRGL